MTDPASIPPTSHPGREVEAIETIGGVMTDLVEITEQLPVRPGHADAAASILDRLSEELGEAAAMLRAGTREPEVIDAELARLRNAFPLWQIAWTDGPHWAGFTAIREGFARANATTPAGLAARIFHYEGPGR